MSNILIKNATVVSMDATIGIVNNAYVLIEGKKVSYVGKERPDVDNTVRVIDADGAIVMPATVNMHTHLAMTYFRSYASDLPLAKWLERIFEIEDKLDEEAMYYGSLIACAEAMEHGTACVNDMYLNTFGTAQACVDSGIRAYLSRCVVDSDGHDGCMRRMAENKLLWDRYNGYDERINVINSAHAEYTCSSQALKMVYEDAKDKKVPVHMHISETVSEVAECRKRHAGRTPLKLLNDLGVLEDSTTYAAHCVALDAEDVDIIRNHKIFPIHNPASNLKLGSGISPVNYMMSQGINVCIGTDGNGSNNNIDMFREMYLTAVLQKGISKKPDCLDAYQVMKMATVYGANALGYDGGRIAVGSVADIIVLKKSAYLYPCHDHYGILVYSATGADVRYTIVNGKITVAEGECVTVNKQKALENFIRISNKLFSRSDSI